MRVLCRSLLTASCIALLLRPIGAGAADYVGKVTGLVAYEAGNVFLFKVDTYAGGPACATSGRLALSLTTPQAKPVIATIMQAYAMGVPITVRGAGVCNLWGNAETAQYVCIGNIPC